jgi:hypothetical protein
MVKDGALCLFAAASVVVVGVGVGNTSFSKWREEDLAGGPPDFDDGDHCHCHCCVGTYSYEQ